MRIGEEGRGDRGIRKKNFCWSGVLLVIKVGGGLGVDYLLNLNRSNICEEMLINNSYSSKSNRLFYICIQFFEW